MSRTIVFEVLVENDEGVLAWTAFDQWISGEDSMGMTRPSLADHQLTTFYNLRFGEEADELTVSVKIGREVPRPFCRISRNREDGFLLEEILAIRPQTRFRVVTAPQLQLPAAQSADGDKLAALLDRLGVPPEVLDQAAGTIERQDARDAIVLAASAAARASPAVIFPVKRRSTTPRTDTES